MTDLILVVAILFGLALVVALSLGKARDKPYTPPPGSLLARTQELEAQEAVRTQHTVQAEPMPRHTPGGWRT